MGALTTDTGRSYERFRYELVPLAAGVEAISGGQAMLITSGASAGYYAPASSAKVGVLKGAFAETVDNTAGADGAVSANMEYGQELFCECIANDTGGTPVVATDRGKLCYALDDQTVTMAVTSCAAGIVHGITSDGLVEVEVLPATRDSEDEMPRVQTGTSTLVAGTKVVAGALLTANSRIQITMKDPGAGAITGFAAFDTPAAGRNVGAGTFTVNAIDDAKATIATAVCTFDWTVLG